MSVCMKVRRLPHPSPVLRYGSCDGTAEAAVYEVEDVPVAEATVPTAGGRVQCRRRGRRPAKPKRRQTALLGAGACGGESIDCDADGWRQVYHW